MASKTFFRIVQAAALAGGALLAAWVWLSQAPPAPPETLVVAVAKNLMGLPLLAAERQGYFAAEGLQVALRPYPFGLPAFEAMQKGEAEVATVAETPLVLASLDGQTFGVIANYMFSVGQRIVARGDLGIVRIEDLRGRRVGVALGTTPHYLLHVMLSDVGLSEADIVVVPLPGPQQAEALAAGRVDAVAAVPPYTAACQRALGRAAVSFAPALRYQGYSNLVAARDFARRRPQAALRLLRSVDRGIAWMREHREEAIQLAVEEIGTDRTALLTVWDDLRPGLILDQGFVVLLEAEARWAIETGLAPPGAVMPDYLDYIDASALRALHPEAVTMIRGS